MNLDSIATIVRREYVERVRTKSFAFMTILIPGIMLVGFVVPDFVSSRSTPSERRIAISDATGMLADTLIAGLQTADGSTRNRFDVVDADSGSIRTARQMVAIGEYDALVMIPDDVFDAGRAVYVRSKSGRGSERRRVEVALGSHVTEFRLVRAGIDARRVANLLRGVEVESVNVAPEAGVSRETAIFGTVMMALLMYISLMLYGAWTLQGVLKDKTGRIAEILVSTISPTDLMIAKVVRIGWASGRSKRGRRVGIGSVGLTQVGIWLAALGLTSILAPASPIGAYAAALGGSSMVAFLLLYVVGFLLFATLYAGVGGICSSLEDAQHVQWPILILSWVPVFLISPAAQDPYDGLVVALSYVPFFSPVLMMMRIGAGAAGWMETGIVLCLMVATTVAAAWAGGRLFRTGILMTGKRPTLKEMWRWLRQA